MLLRSFVRQRVAPWVLAACVLSMVAMSGTVGAQEPTEPAAPTVDTTATWEFFPSEGAVAVEFGYRLTNTTVDLSYPGFFETLPVGALDVVATAAGQALTVTPVGAEDDGFQVWFVELGSPLAPGNGIEATLDWRLAGPFTEAGAPVLGPGAIAVDIYAPGGEPGAIGAAQLLIPASFGPYGATEELASTEVEGDATRVAYVVPTETAYEPYPVQFTNPAAFVERSTSTNPVVTVMDWDTSGEWASDVVARIEERVDALDGWFGARVEPATLRRGLAGSGHPAPLEVIGDEASEIDHQLAHVWLESLGGEEEWFVEGMAEAFSGVSYDSVPGSEIVAPLADRLGPDGVRAVIDALRAESIAYPGEGGESQPIPPDWRTLLDLIENVGRADGAADSFRSVIEAVAPDEPEALALLDQRAAARLDFSALADRAGAWSLPPFLRLAMAEWDFDQFFARQGAVSDLVVRRDGLDAWAAELELDPRSEARSAFERATDDLTEAAAALDAQEAALEAFQEAERLVTGDRGLLSWVGLIGADPDTDLQDLRTAWDEGDDERVERSGHELASQVEGAVGRGTVRLLIPAALLLALGQAIRWLRRRTSTSREAQP